MSGLVCPNCAISNYTTLNSPLISCGWKIAWKQSSFWFSPFIDVCVRAAALEAMPIPREANCMKFQPLLGWRPASTTHYNKIITGANFSICKGLKAKKQGRFNNLA